jgi:hypothetical protein
MTVTQIRVDHRLRFILDDLAEVAIEVTAEERQEVGRLTLFGGGRQLHVPADSGIEVWTVAGPGQLRTVYTPGGGLSVGTYRSAKQVDGRALGAAAVGQLSGVGVGHLDEVRSRGEGCE